MQAFSKWLAEHGASVDVVAAGQAGGLFYEGGAVGSLRRRPVRGAAEAVGFCGRLAAAAWRRRRQWDAVVSHWVAPCGIVGAMLGRPHLAIAHGSDLKVLGALPGGRAALARVARSADLVYVAEALRVDGAPGRVVPMAVDAPVVADRGSARAALGVDGLVALVMGRLSEEKGVDLAIDALPPDVTLLIAGAGPERARLVERAAGRAVRFLGEVRGARKAEAFAAADFLVVPSRRDGAPTVVTEAALASLPIVASSVGGIPELLRAHEAVLCEPTVEALRAGVEKMRDADFRARIARCARAHAEERTWVRIGPRLAGRLGERLYGQPGEITVTRV